MAIHSLAGMEPEQLQHITWKQLYRKPETLRLPFHLMLADNQGSVFCEKRLRLLPGKRIVFKGRFQNQSVIVKLFIEPGRAATHFARELSGITSLVESGTPTPRLLFHGKTQRYQIPVLITEYLTGATDLLSLWQTSDDKDSLAPLMQAVIIELATQHVQGILQHDLHFGNLLIRHHRIFSLDGDSIECFGAPLSHRQSLDHLALFFAQLGAGQQALQKLLLKTYADARGWRLKPSELKHLAKTTRLASRHRLRRYQKKVLRSSSEIRTHRRFDTRIWYSARHDSPALQQLLRDPDAVFRRKETTLLKNGRSATVARIAIDDRIFVIKRYNMKNTLHWLRRCLRPARAVHCWQKAHCLRLSGIPTAAPVACIEKHLFGLRRHSWFITEHVAGKNLLEDFASFDITQPHFTEVAKNVVHLLSQLQEMGISHGDLKATNFLVEGDKPILVDLDGMKSSSHFRKDFQRFMANWTDQPAIAALFDSLFASFSSAHKDRS